MGVAELEPLGQLAFGTFSLIPVALLDGPEKLVVAAFGLHQVIVSQLAPLGLDVAFQLLPLAGECIAVHHVLHR